MHVSNLHAPASVHTSATPYAHGLRTRCGQTCHFGAIGRSRRHVGVGVEPDKRSGKPCIRGLRITVYDVLDYLAAGMTEAQILADFPALREEDIRACLAFAADRERKFEILSA